MRAINHRMHLAPWSATNRQMLFANNEQDQLCPSRDVMSESVATRAVMRSRTMTGASMCVCGVWCERDKV